MSNKYYWEGVDITDITGTTSVNTNINNYFSGFPGNTADATEISTQDGIITNESNFDSLPTPNTSYFCYNDDEDTDAPDYTVNGTSIFTKTISSQRLLVSNTALSHSAGNGTINIPSWCNGVKIIFFSTKGNDGSASNVNVSASNNNYDEHNNDDYTYDHNYRGDRGFYRSRHHNNHRNHHHRHFDTAHNYAAQSGGAAGTGGIGRVGWFLKGVTFTAGSSNTIDYSITQTAASNSTITVKENGSNKAIITIGNGGNAGNGTAAQYGTTDNTHNNQTHDHYNHGTWHHNNQNHYNHTHGSVAGVKGSAGSDGTMTFSGSTPIYLYYNNSNTSENTRAIIYYFRYKTS